MLLCSNDDNINFITLLKEGDYFLDNDFIFIVKTDQRDTRWSVSFSRWANNRSRSSATACI
jgi:hypothetical protein